MEFTEQISLACNGDRDAMDQLLSRWRPWLRNKARGILGDGQRARLDSSDVVQVALTEAYQNLKNFRGKSTGEWASWLHRILLSQAIRLRRHNAAEMRRVGREVAPEKWSFEDVNQNPSAALLQSERHDRVQLALRALPDAGQELIARRIFRGESFNEISRNLDETPRKIRRRWLNAMRTLAESLGDASDSESNES